MADDTKPGYIHAKLIDLMSTVGAIGKNGFNNHHKFKFRGIDDVMKEVHAAQLKHGVTILPTVLSREVSTAGKMTVVSLEVRYRFTAYEDGSYVDIVVWGEAADSQDKATSKAMSMALKYGLIQALMIPTEDIADGDTDSPVVDRSQPRISPEERQFAEDVAKRIAAASSREELNRIYAQVKDASGKGLTEATATDLTTRMHTRAKALEAAA